MRTVLVRLARTKILDSFFLTGGTALSVFYLEHRISEDLDFFSVDTVDLGEIDFLIKRAGFDSLQSVKSSKGFIRCLIDGVKVDLVHDPLSLPGNRTPVAIDDTSVAVDFIENIFSNKLTTLVSRTEPKDFIDFFFLNSACPDFTLDRLYTLAGKKDAIFDDPASAAYRIEENLNAILKLGMLPTLLKIIDVKEFEAFFRGIIAAIYRRQN